MATGDITSPTIVTETNGMTYSTKLALAMAVTGTFAFGMGTNNDPSAATARYTITRPGFDATGAATTVSDTVYETRVMRKAYPNDAQNDVTASGSDALIHSALSDFLYSGETVTVSIGAGIYTVSGTPTNAVPAGTAVTNSSTNAYPKCICRSVTVPYFRANGTIVDEVFAAHRSARNGKPVACVVFTYTDQHAHSVSYTVAAMTLSAANASGIKLPVYAPPNLTAAGLVAAGLTDGDTITRTYKAYPWVGDASAVFDSATTGDGVAQPDEREGPFSFLLDSAGTALPPLYVVIDSATGNDTTGVASTTLATAAASRCATLGGAKTKAAAIRANGEGVIRYLVDNGGTGYAFAGSANAWNQTTPARVWDMIAPHPTLGTKAGAIISSGDNSNANGKIRFSGLTLANASTGAITGSTTTLSLWLDSCVVNLTGGTATIYSFKVGYFTDNSVTALAANGLREFGGTHGPWKLVRGNTTAVTTNIPTDLYTVVANVGNFRLAPISASDATATGQTISSNAVVAYNKLTAYNDTSNDWCKTDPSTAHANWLIACNAVCCAAGSRSQSLVNLKGDSDVAAGNNFLVWHNTFCSPTNASSARANLGYNDTGANAPARTNWSIVGNNFGQYNNKDDATVAVTANAARTGAWSVGYMLGAFGNVIEAYGSTGDAEHSFGPEFAGLYTKDQPQSQAYTNTATGDLTPASGSPSRNLIPAARAVLPYDLAGSPYSASGTTVTAGAYQYAADFTAAASPSGGAFLNSAFAFGFNL